MQCYETVKWGSEVVQLCWHPENFLPEKALVSSVHGYCFYQGKLLVVKNRVRGWELAGGHLEPGETLNACFEREVYEEARVRVMAPTLLGYIEVNNRQNPSWSDASPYPEVGYLCMMWAQVQQVEVFEPHEEITERRWIHSSELPVLHNQWLQTYEGAHQAALRQIDQEIPIG